MQDQNARVISQVHSELAGGPLQDPQDAGLVSKARSEIVRQKVYPTKFCPFCIRPIALDALVCKFCTQEVNTEAEVDDRLKEYFQNLVEEKLARRIANLLGGGLIGLVSIFWLLSR